MVHRPPLQPDRPQRYWRRRANRRVRQVRRTRTALRWGLVLLANSIVAGMLVGAGWRLFRHATTTQLFALERIEIDGTTRTNGDAIRQRLSPFVGRNLLDLNLHEIVAVASRDPWALNVAAKRIFPHTVRVTVEERTPCAVAVISGVAHVIDGTGFVVGPSGASLPDDLPVLVGLDATDDESLLADLRLGARTVQRLRRAAGPWVDRISELDLSEADRIVVRTVDPGPRVLLDPHQVTRNVVSYVDLRREIARRVGPMDYVDLRWRDRITVKPMNDAIEEAG